MLSVSLGCERGHHSIASVCAAFLRDTRQADELSRAGDFWSTIAPSHGCVLRIRTPEIITVAFQKYIMGRIHQSIMEESEQTASTLCIMLLHGSSPGLDDVRDGDALPPRRSR